MSRGENDVRSLAEILSLVDQLTPLVRIGIGLALELEDKPDKFIRRLAKSRIVPLVFVSRMIARSCRLIASRTARSKWEFRLEGGLSVSGTPPPPPGGGGWENKQLRNPHSSAIMMFLTRHTDRSF